MIVEKKGLPEINVKLRIVDKSELNMYALSRRTIVITRGLYENQSDAIIESVTGHEFGHLYNEDAIQCLIIHSLSFVLILSFSLSTITIFILNLIRRWTCNILLYPVFFITSIGVRFIGASLTMLVFYASIMNIILRFMNRKHEYRADIFSAELGFGKPLMSYFNTIKNSDLDKNIFSRLFNTHPKTILRIGNIERYLIKKTGTYKI